MQANGGLVAGRYGVYRRDDVANVIYKEMIQHRLSNLESDTPEQSPPSVPPTILCSFARTSATALLVRYPCIHHPRLTARAWTPCRSEQQDKGQVILAGRS